MQNAAEISPAIFRVMSVFGRKRQGDKTARGRNDHEASGFLPQGKLTGWVRINTVKKVISQSTFPLRTKILI